MQDAIVNASRFLGVHLTQEEMNKRCRPGRIHTTSVQKIMESIRDIITILPQQNVHSMKGGVEYNLLNFQDGKVQLVGCQVEDFSYPKGEYQQISKHAFIHVAHPLPNFSEHHIGAIIDNTMEHPICLVEHLDISNVNKARELFSSFFSCGNHTSVRIQFVYILEKK